MVTQVALADAKAANPAANVFVYVISDRYVRLEFGKPDRGCHIDLTASDALWLIREIAERLTPNPLEGRP